MLSQISAKNLGALALPDACERCFWLKAKLKFRVPWGIFPGIFSSIDAHTKHVTQLYYAKTGRQPPWLNYFGDLGIPVVIPHHSKFRAVHTPTGITLTGVPDDVYRRPNKTLAILDNKTARYTEHQDELLPVYRVQLSGYAWIAEQIKLGITSVCGLVYYEPITAFDQKHLSRVLLVGEDNQPTGIRLEFSCKILPIKPDLDEVTELLARAERICRSSTPPSPRPKCKECQLIEELTKYLSN